MTSSTEQSIQRYLRTGEHEDALHAWAGENAFASAPLGHAALLNALIAAVRTRAAHASVPKVLVDLDVVAFTRPKVAPMVQGLFPANEQATVLEILGWAVVFLTPPNIDTVLGSVRWLSTAWDLANLYLASVNAPLLSDSAPRIVGLSEETTGYVSADYFREANRFDDFVVHEVAHIFHNCKRETIALPPIRGGRDRLCQARDLCLRLRSLQPASYAGKWAGRAGNIACRASEGAHLPGRSRRYRRIPRYPRRSDCRTQRLEAHPSALCVVQAG